jgi:poly(3-hydroxybutyrate) depolymerase
MMHKAAAVALALAAFLLAITACAAAGPPSERAPADGRMAIGTNVCAFTTTDRFDPLKEGFQSAPRPFKERYVESLRTYSVLRFMDWAGTNCSPVRSWDERKQPDDPKQGMFLEDVDDTVAYEWCIALCNQVGADMWVCLPHRTEGDPQFWTNLATLIRDRLDPGLRVYVEYSNETWNGAFGSWDGDPDLCQYTYCDRRGKAAPWAAEVSPDADRYEASPAGAFTVDASCRLWETFGSVFGGEFDQRVVTVLSGWAGNHWENRGRIRCLHHPEINPTGIMPDAFAVAPYLDNPDDHFDGTLPEIWDRLRSAFAPGSELLENLDQTRALLEEEGIDFITYEGGQHIVRAAAGPNDDPRMYGIYAEFLPVMDRYFSLFVHWFDRGYFYDHEAFGAEKHIGQPIEKAHKKRAFRDWLGADIPRAPAPSPAPPAETAIEDVEEAGQADRDDDRIIARDEAPEGYETVRVGNEIRAYFVHTPPEGSNWPVVVNMHGLGCTPENQQEWSRLDAVAEREGFLVAYPKGWALAWNGPEDVPFIAAMLDQIEERHDIDETRVYATGFSAGGFMSHYLGIAMSDRIAAFASVEGLIPFGIWQEDFPRPDDGVSAMIIHNRADGLIGYDGVARTVQSWVKWNDCPAEPKERSRDGQLVREAYGPGRDGSEVVLISFEDDRMGGHFWPWEEGGGVNPAEEMWAFFARHRRE